MIFASTLTPGSPVPPSYVGLWKRCYIQRRNCSIDSSTQAWWFQSPRFHIDLRLPSDRLVLVDAHSLTQLTTQDWRRFAKQTCFAGLTKVNSHHCEWQPEIVFPKVEEKLDAGIIRFDAPDRIHETGIDGRYTEEWSKIEVGPVVGLRLQAKHEVAYLLSSKNWVAWALGTPCTPATPSAALSRSWTNASFAIKAQEESTDWIIHASIQRWTEGEIFSPAQTPIIKDISHLNIGDLVSLPFSKCSMSITHIDR